MRLAMATPARLSPATSTGWRWWLKPTGTPRSMRARIPPSESRQIARRASVVRTAIMPQPMSTPTAAGTIAPRVGMTLPTVAPLPRCTSGITATCPPRIGSDATLAICASASGSTGTPSVHIRTLRMVRSPAPTG